MLGTLSDQSGSSAGGAFSRLAEYIERKNSLEKIKGISQDIVDAYTSGELIPDDPQRSAKVLQRIAEKNEASIPELQLVMEKFAGIVRESKKLGPSIEEREFAKSIMSMPGVPLEKEAAMRYSELTGMKPRVELGATGQALQEEGGPTVNASILSKLLRDQGVSDIDKWYTSAPPPSPRAPTTEVGLLAQLGPEALEKFYEIKGKTAPSGRPHYVKFNNRLLAIYPDGTKKVVEEGSLEQRAILNAMRDPAWELAVGDELKQADIIERHKRLLTGSSGMGKYGTANDVKNAYMSGKISKEAALKILREKFGME